MGWIQRNQVALYLAALGAGAVLGLVLPQVAGPAEAAVTPVLALLLYATFLGVPFGRIAQAFRDVRFLLVVAVLNFVLVPAVVFVLSRLIAEDRALLVGALFVLLTPCVDYVIVFTGLAGGARDRLLAATPLLMLGQMLLLPVFLWLFLGPGFVGSVDLAPFVQAFAWIIVVPLVAAGLTQVLAARTRAGRRAEAAVLGTMVPLMMLTLAVVVASQIHRLGGQIAALLPVLPVYVLFVAVMLGIGALTDRIARVDVPGRRAIVFSGVTRNSLVVLPLVLALPAGFELAPLAVVAQTLVELVAMVVLVRLVPRLLPERSAGRRARG